MRNGLSEEGALKAITINAAKAIGLADRVGSLEVGKDADVCLYDMHPLDARPCKVRGRKRQRSVRKSNWYMRPQSRKFTHT